MTNLISLFLQENKGFGRTFIYQKMEYQKLIRKEVEEIRDILAQFEVPLE